MNLSRTGFGCVLALTQFVIACDADSGPAFDATKDCDEGVACAAERGIPIATEERDQCVTQTDRQYGEASARAREELDDAFRGCMSDSACAYTSCIADMLGYSWEPSCKARLFENEGTVELPGFSLPYSETEVRFWVSDAGCLTGVDVDLISGECDVTLRSDVFTDKEGRFLIRDVSVHGRGLCPGWPREIGTSYSTTSSQDTFGTIEVNRPDYSWYSCAAGELTIRVNTMLSGYSLYPDLDLSNLELNFTGVFQKTHLNPSDECTTVL